MLKKSKEVTKTVHMIETSRAKFLLTLLSFINNNKTTKTLKRQWNFQDVLVSMYQQKCYEYSVFRSISQEVSCLNAYSFLLTYLLFFESQVVFVK